MRKDSRFGTAAVAEILSALKRLNGLGTTILLLEQNVAHLQLVDSAYLLETGGVVKSGSGRVVLADARVQRAYFGV